MKYIRIFSLLLLFFVVAAQIVLPDAEIQLDHTFLPPGEGALFGTTPLGQSVATLVVAGAGQTLGIAASALVVSLFLSLALAALSYLLPQKIARAYAYIIDAWLAIPGIFVALSIGYFLPQSFFSVITALVLSEYAALQKFILQRLQNVSRNDYITMAQVMGARRQHVFSWHVLPQLARESGYLFVLTMPSIVLSLASLEFLGVQTGASRLSLGMQIAVYKDYILLYPYLSLAPVLALLLLLFALNEAVKLVKTEN
ncbi:ABC transporter permease subunit [Turneriella parva]|uniref:ABC-type transporter, integral membrane subunit n=1 Tax=Turneriella parva (strain ATCC BAA-1111 / DSM 21527 / NCTC 11395 / H) TaxID=869212 RepID=I4B7B7_TURPD|nr:ABC transporter permease subunit [Turneriella parva]AFM13174.1 ABC-type transporter, integral membrane subunit [Turneriella parva DSM 21527]